MVLPPGEHSGKIDSVGGSLRCSSALLVNFEMLHLGAIACVLMYSLTPEMLKVTYNMLYLFH